MSQIHKAGRARRRQFGHLDVPGCISRARREPLSAENMKCLTNSAGPQGGRPRDEQYRKHWRENDDKLRIDLHAPIVPPIVLSHISPILDTNEVGLSD